MTAEKKQRIRNAAERLITLIDNNTPDDIIRNETVLIANLAEREIFGDEDENENRN